MEKLIEFAEVGSPIGPFLLADAGSGLCSVIFPTGPDDPDRAGLESSLKRRYGGYRLVESPTRLTEAVSCLEKYFGDPAAGTAYRGKLDPGGTEFQRQVWNWLIRIPPGEVATYGEVARRLGRPGASRAVGAACAANPLPIIIPCHRVVGKSGNLTGFGGGLDLKERLLRAEGWIPPE